MIPQWEVIFRLTLSAFAGGLVGMEREANNRPAGLRTHILVAVGACLIMMVSMFGFGGEGDPARLAAQVVSGIGFLGAGTIMTKGNNVRGLTTAASLWVCGGIGLAIGNGYYIGGLATVSIVLFTLVSLGFVEKRLFKKKFRILVIHCEERPGRIGEIGQVCGKHHISIKDIKMFSEALDHEYEPGKVTFMDVYIAIKLPRTFDSENFFRDISKVPGVIHASWEDDQTMCSSVA